MGSSGSVPDGDAPAMRWWGWGDPEHPSALPAHALDFLRASVGVAEQPRPPVALGEVKLPQSNLSESLLAELAALLGADALTNEHEQRVLHAAGKGYPD